MSDGLITRIGKWIDLKFADKVTEAEFSGLVSRINQVDQTLTKLDFTDELEFLRTRIEKIELYSGMTRKIDPMKPPVVKSAFSM